MNPQPVYEQRASWPYVIGVLGALLIVAALAWAIHSYMQPPPLGEDRAAVRAKALAELRAAETNALTTAAWVDPGKGIIRLPIQDAMAIIEREWGRNPAAARSNLIARVEKATAAPPKAPQKPSEFE